MLEKRNTKFRNDVEIFCENSTVSQNTLRRRAKQRIVYQCAVESCKISDTWQNVSIILQLDHINGVKKDNRIENLRWLCPNCHSQTITWGYKKRKILVKDLNKIDKRKLPKLHRRKVDRPSKEDLEELIKVYNWSKLGKMFGVSDNAIRKWARSYNLLQ